MTRPTAPNGDPLPRKHVAHLLATVTWAGATIADDGGRLVVRGDRGGLLQAVVTRRERDIRAWWAACEEGKGVQG